MKKLLFILAFLPFIVSAQTLVTTSMQEPPSMYLSTYNITGMTSSSGTQGSATGFTATWYQSPGGNDTITAPTGFVVSADSSTWGSSETFTPGAVAGAKRLYVALSSSNLGASYSGNVTISARGLSPTLLAVSGTTSGSSITYGTVQIPATSVSGGADLNNFPVVVDTIVAALKDASHGGTVTNRNNIIVGTSTSFGTLLNWEIVKWDSTTGAIEMWVKVPTLSHTTTTTFYIGYGALGYSSFQGGATGAVWGSNAYGIWHMGETLNGATQQTVYDWGSNSHPLLSRGTWTTGAQAAGIVGGSIGFSGSNYFGFIPATFAGDFSCSGWFKISIANGSSVMFGDSTSSTGTNFFGSDYRAFIGGAVAQDQVVDGTATSLTTWTYLTITRASGTWTIYHNGTSTATASPTLHTFLYSEIGGNSAGQSPQFAADEVQLWNVALPGGWITTTYNNQSSPSTFYIRSF